MLNYINSSKYKKVCYKEGYVRIMEMIKQIIRLPNKSPSINILKFTSLEFFFWATLSTYYPFIVVFLMSKGYSSTIIGTILAINSFVVVIAQPFWGMVSDWVQSVKKVFILCLAIAACIMLTLPLYQSVLTLIFVFALLTFFESPLPPLMDSWVIQGIQAEKHIAYGNIRLWGSLGFSLFVYVMGKTLDYVSINIVFPAFAILASITIFMSTRIKITASAKSIPLKNLKIGKLLKNYYYVTFLIFAVTLFIPHRASALFLANLIADVGGTQEQLGLSFSLMALSEVPIFLFSRRLIKKYKPVYLILISTVFFIIRQILFLYASTPLQAILLQMLQGPSFALFLTGTVYYIDSLAPQALKSTAQTGGSAVFFGVSGIIGSFGGGWIIDNMGLHQMYLLGIIMSAIISILFILSLYLGKWFNLENI